MPPAMGGEHPLAGAISPRSRNTDTRERKTILRHQTFLGHSFRFVLLILNGDSALRVPYSETFLFWNAPKAFQSRTERIMR